MVYECWTRLQRGPDRSRLVRGVRAGTPSPIPSSAKPAGAETTGVAESLEDAKRPERTEAFGHTNRPPCSIQREPRQPPMEQNTMIKHDPAAWFEVRIHNFPHNEGEREERVDSTVAGSLRSATGSAQALEAHALGSYARAWG